MSRGPTSVVVLHLAENIHLLRKGKYHSIADLLFVLFGLSYFVYAELTTHFLVWLNQNKSTVRSAVQ